MSYRNRLITALLALILIAGCSSDGGASGEPTGTAAASTTTNATTAAPTTTDAAPETSTTAETSTTIDPDTALEAEFMAEIESLAAALDGGDIEAYMELIQSSLSDAERDRVAFFAVSAPVHMLLDECEVLSVSGFMSEAVCPTEIFDPVRLEFGPADGQLGWARYGDGLSPMGDGSIDGRMYADSSTAYAAYLQQYLPDEYSAACDPSGYDREIRYEYGVSLTQECGELLASVAEDVARWLRDGQPAP